MGASKNFLLMRAIMMTTLAIIASMNVGLIVALVMREYHEFAVLMGLPSAFCVVFGLLSVDMAMFLVFKLFWPVRGTIDDKICSQVLLEKGHDYGVSIKENPLIDATYIDHKARFELQDTIKALENGLDPVLRSKCANNLQEQVMIVDKQDETFGIGENPKISNDRLFQTIDKETSASKALYVEPNKSFACHDSVFLSRNEGNVSNLVLPCGQAPTSKFYSINNVLDNTDYLGLEGFVNREVEWNATSAALSQQVDRSIAIRCNEIIESLKFNKEYVSSMNYGRIRNLFSAHLEFADILDEFWGNLFDLHGELTKKGKIIRLDLLIGLDIEDKIQSSPYYFDRTPGGRCDPFKLTLPAVVELRRCIMGSFLKDNPTLLQDEKVSYFGMENDLVQYEVLIYENFHRADQSVGVANNSTSFWSSCPLEELKTVAVLVQKCPSYQLSQHASQINVCFSPNELKGLLLNSFRGCIQNIADLEKADLLFTQRGEYDEKLIGLAAEMVIFRDICPNGSFSPNAIVNSDGKMFNLCTSVLGCGDTCMWQPSLIISFGVWCISRIFELLLSVKKSVPLGKYSSVLSRLQGIMGAAFLNPAEPLFICPCTDTVPNVRLPDGSRRISAEALLVKLMEVEDAIHGLENSEGKRNLQFILQHYKCWLTEVVAFVAGQK